MGDRLFDGVLIWPIYGPKLVTKFMRIREIKYKELLVVNLKKYALGAAVVASVVICASVFALNSQNENNSKVLRTEKIEFTRADGTPVAEIGILPEKYPGIMLTMANNRHSAISILQASSGALSIQISDNSGTSRSFIIISADSTTGIEFSREKDKESAFFGINKEGDAMIELMGADGTIGFKAP